MPKDITLEEIRYYFYFKRPIGELVWKNPTSPKLKRGDATGNITSHRYKEVVLHGKKYKAHRLIYMCFHGIPKYSMLPNVIDHIDRNSLNNHPSNLRASNHILNARNCDAYKNNKSGHRGVYYRKNTGKWQAYIKVEGKSIHIGYFTSKKVAIKARLKAEKEYGY